jgi:hypothetical protein
MVYRRERQEGEGGGLFHIEHEEGEKKGEEFKSSGLV